MRKKPHLIEYLLRSVYDESFVPLDRWVVVIRHHGALGGEKRIKGSLIKRVDRRGFYYESGSDELFIPYYRLIRLELS